MVDGTGKIHIRLYVFFESIVRGLDRVCGPWIRCGMVIWGLVCRVGCTESLNGLCELFFFCFEIFLLNLLSG